MDAFLKKTHILWNLGHSFLKSLLHHSTQEKKRNASSLFQNYCLQLSVLVKGTMSSGPSYKKWKAQLLLAGQVIAIHEDALSSARSGGLVSVFNTFSCHRRRISWNSSYKEERPGMRGCSKPVLCSKLGTMAPQTSSLSFSHQLRSTGISSSEKTSICYCRM